MTVKQQKLIENYVRLKVKSMLNESSVYKDWANDLKSLCNELHEIGKAMNESGSSEGNLGTRLQKHTQEIFKIAEILNRK